MCKLYFSAMLAFILVTVTPAFASLQAVGPANIANGFPMWYMDASDLILELCKDPDDPLCIADPVIPGNAFSEQMGFGRRAFWWSAEADLNTRIANGTAGKGSLNLELRAEFSNQNPAPDEQVTLGVLGIRADVPVDGRYVITHPFGVAVFDVMPERIASTGGVLAIDSDRPAESGFNAALSINTDIGDDGCSALPCDFSLALNSGIGPFLEWDAAVAPSVPAGYLGDPRVEHKVVGSPFGTDFFRIEGPAGSNLDGNGNDAVQTDKFRVSGKIDSIPPEGAITSGANTSGTFKIGDTITFTLTPSLAEPGAAVTGSYNGVALTWSTANNGITYTATYTVANGHADRATPLQISGVVITDATGNPSAPIDGSDVMKTIDANPPPAPVVTSPTVPEFVNADSTAISGIAEANSLVRIKSGTTVTGSQQLTGGATNFLMSVLLAQNAVNTFAATATDAAGNEGPAATVPDITEDSLGVTVDINYNPSRPVRDSDTLRLVITFSSVVAIDETPGNAPTISIDYSGTDADVVNSAMTRISNLIWLFDAGIPSGNNGVATVTISGKNTNGVLNRPATNTQFIVDNTIPAAPVIASPAGNIFINADNFSITGTAESNSRVRIKSGTTVVGSQQLTGGEAGFSISVPLNQNAVNAFNATAINAAGTEGPAAQVPDITEDSINPAINFTAITASVTQDTAAITWKSSEPSTSVVFYGTTADTPLNAASVDLTTSNSVTLAGLFPSTLYFYNVSSCDAAGNCNASSQFDFTTSAAPAPPPPAPSGGGGGGSSGSSGGSSSGVVVSAGTDTSIKSLPKKDVTPLPPEATTPVPTPEPTVEQPIEQAITGQVTASPFPGAEIAVVIAATTAIALYEWRRTHKINNRK